MKLNSDFNLRVVINTAEMEWTPSPMAGVERKMLDRIGGEVARATSIVRYAAGSSFSAHTHGGGEEFFVLEGVFNDSNGSYPAGTYVRNPAGSSHAPWAGPEGAVIFVKLHQFDEEDNARVVINTFEQPWFKGIVNGLSVMPLHEFAGEHIALVKWEPNTRFNPHHHWGGEEILVLEGIFRDEYGNYPAGSWLRSPHLSKHQPYTGDDGAVIYVKTGHLAGMTDRWQEV
ncbi:MAG: cupin domain-containing protein [Pseudohongiella sp.]|nr:cupin domain-containing protein [Pseudohongiella sp.]